MRRGLAVWVGTGMVAITTVVFRAPAAAASVHARITIGPKIGSPTSSFVVRFRAPVSTGTLRNVRREFELSLAGRSGAAGCVAEGAIELPPARAHTNVKITLTPRRFGGRRWCPGGFRGRIQVTEAPRCPPHEICPALILLVGTVGTFSFHVTPPGGDAIPPRFAGLTRAIACTPGAQRPGQTAPVLLSWSAATDNRTPAAQIVYDIFMATAHRTENFLSPTWTTAPGATSFRTPGLPSHAAAYFVVRARDRAGNEDANTVERPLVDPCL